MPRVARTAIVASIRRGRRGASSSSIALSTGSIDFSAAAGSLRQAFSIASTALTWAATLRSYSVSSMRSSGGCCPRRTAARTMVWRTIWLVELIRETQAEQVLRFAEQLDGEIDAAGARLALGRLPGPVEPESQGQHLDPVALGFDSQLAQADRRKIAFFLPRRVVGLDADPREEPVLLVDLEPVLGACREGVGVAEMVEAGVGRRHRPLPPDPLHVDRDAQRMSFADVERDPGRSQGRPVPDGIDDRIQIPMEADGGVPGGADVHPERVRFEGGDEHPDSVADRRFAVLERLGIAVRDGALVDLLVVAVHEVDA